MWACVVTVMPVDNYAESALTFYPYVDSEDQNSGQAYEKCLWPLNTTCGQSLHKRQKCDEAQLVGSCGEVGKPQT